MPRPDGAVGLPPREAAGAKAPGAFRTIGEVADDLDVPQHVLRFWETRFPQIRPLKRGGGRRYYRREDVDLVRGVRTLLYGQGYTIKGVQRILREGGARQVQAIGRGDATAVPPPAAEVEESEPATVVAAESIAEPPGIDRRAALEGALDELVECRRILRALRADPARDEGA